MGKSPKENETKKKAQEFYLTGHFTQTQIADIVGKSDRTIIRWADEGKWDIILESMKSTKEKRIGKYKGYLDSIEQRIESRDILERFPSNNEIDQMAKLESIIKKLQDNASVGEIVMYSKNICKFVQAYDVEKSKDVSEIFDGYIKSLA